MSTYNRHRFAPGMISYTVWLYYHVNLSHRDIKDLLVKRGISVSREAMVVSPERPRRISCAVMVLLIEN